MRYCCDQKARAASAQSSTLWQQAIIEITCHDHSIKLVRATYTCGVVLRATYTCGVVLRAHPICGESHIQCYASGYVATTSPPFHKEQHRSHILFVKVAPGTTFTSWSQHHFVAIRKPERQVRKASHFGSKQQ